MTIGVHELTELPCPTCGTVAERTTYDIGSGPELSCATCEWCWGANGQPLQPLDLRTVADSMDPETRALTGIDKFLRAEDPSTPKRE